MRAIYAVLAVTLMTLAFTGAITPAYVLAITAVMGLVRPSDVGMRAAVVGDTMPAPYLMGAMSIQRTTQDSARIAGALTGAGLAATLGMGPAYVVVAGLYATSVLLTLKAGAARPAPQPVASAANPSAVASPWRDLRDGLAYVWNTPHLLAVMCLAFLINLTAFPIYNGLLPYVAKEVYGEDQTLLGYLVAGAASGALIGSVALTRLGGLFRPARMMIAACAVWYGLLLVFAHTPHPTAGIPVLLLAGCALSASQVPMATVLLRTSDMRFRGRVMGIRMLAIYGNLPGLLLSGPLIAGFGFPLTATLYCAIGLTFTTLIALRWRTHLWRPDASANLP